MKFKLLSLAILSVSASSYADYHISTSLTHHMYEETETYDFGESKDETDLTTLDLQVYFNGVETGHNALKESGFLSKSSSLYLEGRRFAFKDTFISNNSNQEPDKFSSNFYTEKLGGYGVINDRGIVGGSLENYQGDTLFAELEGGAYIGESASITGIIGRVMYEDDDFDQSDETIIGVKYHQVFMPENDFSIALDAQLRRIDDSNMSSAELSFYFTKNQGLEVSYEGLYRDSDGFTYHYDTFGLAYHLFFNQTFGLELEVATGDWLTDDKETSYGVGIMFNF